MEVDISKPLHGFVGCFSRRRVAYSPYLDPANHFPNLVDLRNLLRSVRSGAALKKVYGRASFACDDVSQKGEVSTVNV